MDFEFEDLDIEIAVGGEGGEDVSEAAGDADTASTELENVICTFEKGIKRLDNLSAAADHFTKFGVTKQALHLYNKGNKLGKAIGVALPTYESDEEVAAGDADVEIEITVEAIGEVYDKTKQWIIDFFKRIYQAIKDFFGRYFGLAARLEKRLNKIKSELIGKNVDRDKFSKIKMNTYSFGDFNKIANACSTVIDEVAKSLGSFSDISSSMVTALKAIGWEVEVEKDGSSSTSKIESITWTAAEEYQKETEELGKLDWTWATVEKSFSDTKQAVKALKEQSRIEKKIKDAEKKLIADRNSTVKNASYQNKDNAQKLADVALTNAAKYVSCYIRACKEAVSTVGRLIVIYCSIAEKATIKK